MRCCCWHGHRYYLWKKKKQKVDAGGTRYYYWKVEWLCVGVAVAVAVDVRVLGYPPWLVVCSLRSDIGAQFDTGVHTTHRYPAIPSVGRQSTFFSL